VLLRDLVGWLEVGETQAKQDILDFGFSRPEKGEGTPPPCFCVVTVTQIPSFLMRGIRKGQNVQPATSFSFL
jgi:hypothetical protein